MDSEIIRPATVDEKKDFVELTGDKGRTVKERFYTRLAEIQLKYDKAHKPFCFRCARLDFEDSYTKNLEEARRRNDDKVSEPKVNFDDYSKDSRFELVEEAEVQEFMNVNGVRTPYVSGTNKDFVCKVRRCGITVFVPKVQATSSVKK